MKKLLITVLVGLFVLGSLTMAQAHVLIPGGSLSGAQIHGAASPGIADFIAPITRDINIAGSLGKLYQWVKTGPSGLVFEYQFEMYSGGAKYLNRLSTTDFQGFTTTVDALTAGAGEEQTNAIDRDPTGATVGFSYGTWVGPGEKSTLMWVETNAESIAPAQIFLQNGGQTAFNVYGPAIPEPGTMMLLGMGILGLFGLRKRDA